MTHDPMKLHLTCTYIGYVYHGVQAEYCMYIYMCSSLLGPHTFVCVNVYDCVAIQCMCKSLSPVDSNPVLYAIAIGYTTACLGCNVQSIDTRELTQSHYTSLAIAERCKHVLLMICYVNVIILII